MIVICSCDKTNLKQFEVALKSTLFDIKEAIAAYFHIDDINQVDKFVAYLFGLSDFKGKVVDNNLVNAATYSRYRFILIFENRHHKILQQQVSTCINQNEGDYNELIVEIRLNVDKLQYVAESIFHICLACLKVSGKNGLSLSFIHNNMLSICKYLNKNEDYLKSKLDEIKRVLRVSFFKNM